jgi:hypothetical protein
MSWKLDDYVQVPERMRMVLERFPDVRFQEDRPQIVTAGDKVYIEIRVTAWRNPDDQHPAVAYCWEPFPGTTPYTRDSEQMNAASSAYGRVCALLLPGAFAKIASAQEVYNRAGPPSHTYEEPFPDTVKPTPLRHSDPSPTALSDAQLKKLRAMYNALGITDHQKQAEDASLRLGKQVFGLGSMFKSQASRLIDLLNEAQRSSNV